MKPLFHLLQNLLHVDQLPTIKIQFIVLFTKCLLNKFIIHCCFFLGGHVLNKKLLNEGTVRYQQ